MDHVAVDVGEPEISAPITIRQSFVVQPQQVQHGCMEIMDTRRFFYGRKAEFVGGPVDRPTPDAAQSSPAPTPVHN